MPEALIVFIRGTFAFFSLLLVARIMGKRHISQMTFFDYIYGITVGGMAASLTIDLTLQTIPTLVGVLAWTFWVAVESIVSIYSRTWKRILDGEPTVVVRNGMILEGNLEQLSYTLDDLRVQLRSKGAFDIDEVEFAVLEPDGQLSVQFKSQYQPVTPSDLGIPTGYRGLAVELVMDGRIVEANMKQLDLSPDWLMREIRGMGYRLKDVFYAEIDTMGNLYVDSYDDPTRNGKDSDISDGGDGGGGNGLGPKA